MKTNILKLVICALVMTSFYAARADFIKSTYVGPSDGNWGDPANWSPAMKRAAEFPEVDGTWRPGNPLPLVL